MNKISLEKVITHLQESLPVATFDTLPPYDLRYMPRWEVNNKAYYRIKDTNVIIKTQMKDLSLTSVCLYVTEDVHVNQKLELKIYLSEKENFTAEGTVIWRRTTLGHLCCAGVMFDHLPQVAEDLILAYAFGIN